MNDDDDNIMVMNDIYILFDYKSVRTIYYWYLPMSWVEHWCGNYELRENVIGLTSIIKLVYSIFY